MINTYLSNKLKERIAKFPHLRDNLIAEAKQLSNIGVSSEKDHNDFIYILKNISKVSKNLTDEKISSDNISKISQIVFDNRNNIPLTNFIMATGAALNKINIPIKKIAYPQGDPFMENKNPYNVQKWMEAMRSIYSSMQFEPFSSAFDKITAEWDKMEKKSFKNWISFYEENAHNKYKVAQYYQPGNVIPFEQLKAKLPGVPDMSAFSPSVDDSARIAAEKKERITRKIKSIISRLNAAERLATDPEVQRDLQQCLDIGVPRWLEELQKVKRLVQLSPMRSSAVALLQDLIIRQANQLQKQGHPLAAAEIRKIAQPAPPQPAVDALSQPAAIPSGPAVSPEQEGEEALDEFEERMSADDGNSIADQDDDPLAELTVIAQAVPPADMKPAAPIEAVPEQVQAPIPTDTEMPPMEQPAPANGADIEVEDDAARTEMDPRTDDLFEAALSGVTVIDIINRLETLANLFRTREIPRQLAIIDLMMDKLNISAFFPNLAEASSKSLESNQYALSRVEDILSKIKGSVETPKEKQLDLTGRQPEPREKMPDNINPESVRNNLVEQQADEKAKKEQRKAQEDAKIIEPVTDVSEELSAAPLPGPPPPAQPKPSAPIR